MVPLGRFDRPVTVQAEWYSHRQAWERAAGQAPAPKMSPEDRSWHCLLDEEIQAFANPENEALQTAAKEAVTETRKILEKQCPVRPGERDVDFVARVQTMMWEKTRYDSTNPGARCQHGWEVMTKYGGNGACGTLNHLFAALLQAGGVPAVSIYTQESTPNPNPNPNPNATSTGACQPP